MKHYIFKGIVSNTYFPGLRIQLKDKETEEPPSEVFSHIKFIFQHKETQEVVEFGTATSGVSWENQNEALFVFNAGNIELSFGVWDYQMVGIDASGNERIFMFGQWPISEKLGNPIN